MLYRGIRFAAADLQPAAGAPCSRQVRIENQRALDECHTIVKVPDNIAEAMAAVGERDRVIPSQLGRPSSQALGFGRLVNDPPSSRSPFGARSNGQLWRTPRQIPGRARSPWRTVLVPRRWSLSSFG